MLYSVDPEMIIPYFSQWSEIKFINKGLSTDDKYYVKSKRNGKRYIIRISSVSILERKRNEYEAMKKVGKLNLPIQKYIEYGVCRNENYIYSIYSWIRGEDLEDKILTYPEDEQYSIGLMAGSILRTLHDETNMDDSFDFVESVRNEIDQQNEEYMLCEYKVPNDGGILRFIEENIECLKNRKLAILHGDFHIGNLVTNHKKELGIIDMNWYKFGDPYEDFKKLMFISRKTSIPYAKGQIDGYFNGQVPGEFFRITAVYVAINILFSTLWSSKIGPEELRRDLQRINMVYYDYQGFSKIVPSWYSL